MTGAKRAVPDWVLERERLGELDPAVRATYAAELEGDPEVRARLEALDAADAEILDTYPVRAMAAAIESRAAAPRRRRATWWLLAPIATGAVVAVLSVLPEPRPGGTPVDVGLEAVRLKGESQLLVHRLRDDAIEAIAPHGATATAGDLLQIAYRAAPRSFGVIVSVDGRGVVTRHLSAGTQSAPLEAGGIVTLSHAYELDDAPTAECFYFVVGHTPFAVAPIEAAARAVGTTPDKLAGEAPLVLPEGLEQHVLCVRKVTP